MIEHPYRRIPEPERYCEACGLRLHRRRWANGELEAAKAFAVRRYCDRQCKGAAQANARLSHWTARKLARSLMGDTCTRCGTSEGLQAHHTDGDVRHNTPDNIDTLCISCHQIWHWEKRRAFTLLAREAGVLR